TLRSRCDRIDAGWRAMEGWCWKERQLSDGTEGGESSQPRPSESDSAAEGEQATERRFDSVPAEGHLASRDLRTGRAAEPLVPDGKPALQPKVVPKPRVVPHFTVDERVARGKAARAEVPRRVQGEWEPSPHRPDPVGLLEEQAQTRVPELVPIR